MSALQPFYPSLRPLNPRASLNALGQSRPILKRLRFQALASKLPAPFEDSMQPELAAKKLKPKGVYRQFLLQALKLAHFWESTLQPNIAYRWFQLTHRNATVPEQARQLKKLKTFFRIHPHSLTNRVYQKLWPRELGISVYGTARTNLTDPRLQNLTELAQQVGQAITRWGYFPVTGGGPGTMYDVAVGARSLGGHTAGVTINGIDGDSPNFDIGIFEELSSHPTFPHRLTGPSSFIHRSPRSLILPGGIGTHRELLSVVEDAAFDLTGFPVQKRIVILDPHGFYDDFKAYLDKLVQSGVVSAHQLDSFKFVNTLAEAKQQLFDPKAPWTPGISDKRQRSISFRS